MPISVDEVQRQPGNPPALAGGGIKTDLEGPRMADSAYTPPTGAEARALLKALGLTGAAAGALVGVDSRTVRRWTGGERPMPFASLYTLCGRQARINVAPEHWREQVGRFLATI